MLLQKETDMPPKWGECRTENFIYQATIKTDNSSKHALVNQQKIRIATHNTTINSKPNDKSYLQYKQATELLKLTHKSKMKTVY